MSAPVGGTSAGGVVYEVNLDLDAGIREAYLAWLADHVAEIRALPGFTGARQFEVDDPAPAPGRIGLCVQYDLVDRAALEAYLRDHAPRLRADGQARFGGRFTASRRILTGLA
jgi:quinol monooxygenase YgiN